MKSIVLVVFVLAGLSSCLKHKAIEPNQTIIVVECLDTVSFSNEILPQLLTPSCNTASCHGANAAGGYDLTTYGSVSINSGIILNAMQQNNGFVAMPLGAPMLNDSLLSKFNCWINQGKLNN